MAFADKAVLFRGGVGELGLVILGAIGGIGGALDQRAVGIGDGAHACEVITMHEAGHTIHQPEVGMGLQDNLLAGRAEVADFSHAGIERGDTIHHFGLTRASAVIAIGGRLACMGNGCGAVGIVIADAAELLASF